MNLRGRLAALSGGMLFAATATFVQLVLAPALVDGPQLSQGLSTRNWLSVGFLPSSAFFFLIVGYLIWALLLKAQPSRRLAIVGGGVVAGAVVGLLSPVLFVLLMNLQSRALSHESQLPLFSPLGDSLVRVVTNEVVVLTALACSVVGSFASVLVHRVARMNGQDLYSRSGQALKGTI